jgi:methylase of polypeptide subunit release factors
LSTAGGRELTSLVAGSDEGAVTDTADGTADGTLDFVLCNPPWVPTSVGGLQEEGDIPGAAGVLQGLPLLSLAASDLDGAVFDASSEGMLSRTISLAEARLRPGGHLVVVYSTLAFELGLESKDRVAEEVARCGFEMVLKLDAPRGCAFAQSPTVKEKSAPDPLAAPKKREVVSVYVFQKC